MEKHASLLCDEEKKVIVLNKLRMLQQRLDLVLSQDLSWDCGQCYSKTMFLGLNQVYLLKIQIQHTQ